MKTSLFLPVVLMLLSACSSSSDKQLLQKRWNFASTNIPSLEKIAKGYQTSYGINGFKQVFAASKFILRKDETFDLCLFQNYRHGRWKERNGALVLWPEPSADSLVLIIDSLGERFMQLSIDSNNFQKLGRFVMPFEGVAFFDKNKIARFRFERGDHGYSDLSEDPYSRENNWWRIRPTKPETQGQIHKRILNLVDFHTVMFEDAIERDKKVVTYNWFSSPLIVANNGLALKNYRKIEADWKEYFYDSTQAREGFRLLGRGFDKKMEFPYDIENPFKRNLNMLSQYRRNLQ